MKQSEDVIRLLCDQYRENGIARWAVILRETGEFIGWAGIKYETVIRPGYLGEISYLKIIIFHA